MYSGLSLAPDSCWVCGNTVPIFLGFLSVSHPPHFGHQQEEQRESQSAVYSHLKPLPRQGSRPHSKYALILRSGLEHRRVHVQPSALASWVCERSRVRSKFRVRTVSTGEKPEPRNRGLTVLGFRGKDEVNRKYLGSPGELVPLRWGSCVTPKPSLSTLV